MRLSLVAAALICGTLSVAACSGCHPSPPQPSPPIGPPPPAAPNDYTVYEELVLAQCLNPSDGGVAAVAAEHQAVDQPAWLACLYNGGTIASCAVPCAK